MGQPKDESLANVNLTYFLRYGNDLQILCFPCNQFGKQEPWAEPEIVSWAYKKFGISEGKFI